MKYYVGRTFMKSLKKSIINLYGLPSFGFQLMVNMEVFYFAAFMTDYADLPMSLVGKVLLITSIFDILWVPTAGIILEKSNMKWGKYRSWLFVGPPFAAFFFILQFSKIGSPMTNAIIVTIGFVVSHLIWNIYYAGHIALNSAMTTVREERIAMGSNRGMFNGLGAIAFSLIGLPLITYFGKLSPGNGHMLTVILTGIVMVVCYYVLYFLTKDYAYHGTAASGAPQEKMSIGQMLTQIAVNPPLLGLMLGELGRYLGRFVIFGLAFYYFKYVVTNLAVLTIFFTGLNVVIFVGAFISNPIAKRLGERRAYILSVSIFIICLLAIWALPMNYISFMIVMFIAYIGYAMPDALSVPMYSATVDYGEWKTGKNARGFIMSLINFPIKIAIFVRSVIITAVLTGAGYVANMETTPALVAGVKNGITLYPAIIMLIGLLMLTLLYRITPQSLKKMQEEIAARKSQ